MNTTEKELTRRWVQTWQEAGEALREIKRQELRNYDYAKNLPIIDDMLQWAYEHRSTRLTSGLVEQQYWFMKMHEKLLEQQTMDGRSRTCEQPCSHTPGSACALHTDR